MTGLTTSLPIKRLIAVIALVASGQALAVAGVGDVVADPGAYAYMVQQIKVMNQKLNVAKEQLDKAKKMQRDAERTRRSLEGVYNDVQELHDDYQNIKDIKDIVDYRDDVFQVVNKGSRLSKKLTGLGLDKTIKTRETKRGKVTQRDYGAVYDVLNKTPKTGEQQMQQSEARRALSDESKRTKFTEASLLLEELDRAKQQLLELANKVRANKDNLKMSVDINTHALLDMHKTLINLTKMIAREQQNENL